jgi:hypothetical protein
MGTVSAWTSHQVKLMYVQVSEEAATGCNAKDVRVSLGFRHEAPAKKRPRRRTVQIIIKQGEHSWQHTGHLSNGSFHVGAMNAVHLVLDDTPQLQDDCDQFLLGE